MKDSDEQEIRKVIESYLAAVKTGERALFEKTFYPDAVVIHAGAKDKDEMSTPIHHFAEKVRARVESGRHVEETALETKVSVSGHVANVRVDFRMQSDGKVLFGTDFFNLVKRDQIWKITQKIYDMTSDG